MHQPLKISSGFEYKTAAIYDFLGTEKKKIEVSIYVSGAIHNFQIEFSNQ